MEEKDEFEKAVLALEKIDFSTCSLDNLNVFETTIRYLGGFLSACDLSEGKYPSLLQKAVEMGEMLYRAFDTPNRLPITRWNFNAAATGANQQAGQSVLIAEIGSLTLEFTRLTQLTGDPRFYDAVQRIMDVFDSQQAQTQLPGLWPTVVDARTADFSKGDWFTIGGMADSLYEYLPKVSSNMSKLLVNLTLAATHSSWRRHGSIPGNVREGLVYYEGAYLFPTDDIRRRSNPFRWPD